MFKKREGMESKEICDLVVITFFKRKIIICAFLSFLFPFMLRGRVVQNLISYMIGNVLTSQHYFLRLLVHTRIHRDTCQGVFHFVVPTKMMDLAYALFVSHFVVYFFCFINL